MAKWGEADPRWIVSEAQDGRNVGAWHWCVPKLPGLPMWRELPCRQLDRDGGLAIIRTEIEGVILFLIFPAAVKNSHAHAVAGKRKTCSAGCEAGWMRQCHTGGEACAWIWRMATLR